MHERVPFLLPVRALIQLDALDGAQRREYGAWGDAYKDGLMNARELRIRHRCRSNTADGEGVAYKLQTSRNIAYDRDRYKFSPISSETKSSGNPDTYTLEFGTLTILDDDDNDDDDVDCWFVEEPIPSSSMTDCVQYEKVQL